MNKIHLIGNVVHTPELRTTQTGVNVCKFSIAVSRKVRNAQTGEYETDFFDVQAWRKLAELCANFLEKGKKVAVVGAMQMRDYEGRDGGKRRAWEVVADEVEFLSPRSESTQETPHTAQHNMTREEARAAVKLAAAMSSKTPADQGFTTVEDDELPF